MKAVGMEKRDQADTTVSQPLNILLVGPRRTGKSSTANTLLGQGPVFSTRGGGASATASGAAAGRHLTVVDAQGWGSSEETVPKEDKVELLRAVSLFGPGGPHAVLLVIPSLDFTESEGRAVERRMELLTSAVWRHTMVLFTCGDRLKRRGCSAKQHVQTGGPALHRLMEKCRYRYHVFDNKAVGEQDNSKQEPRMGSTQRGEMRRGKVNKGLWCKNKGGERDGGKEGDEEQVRELLIKVEDMLQENGGWHFSLHMYQRMEEEWSRRESALRCRLEAEADERRERREQAAAEAGNAAEERQRSRMEAKGRGFELKTTETDSNIWHGSAEEEYPQSTKVKMSLVAPCWLNTSQRFAYNAIRKLA